MNQQLQASEGEFIWDGKDKSWKKLPIGVYIILMEATSQANEKVYSETKTVVIGKWNKFYNFVIPVKTGILP